MILIDSLIYRGIGFVLRQVAHAVDAEWNDPDVLREQLLAAQMQLELGQITEEEFAAVESEVLARMRALKERQMEQAPRPGEGRVTGVSIDLHDDYEE